MSKLNENKSIIIYNFDIIAGKLFPCVVFKEFDPLYAQEKGVCRRLIMFHPKPFTLGLSFLTTMSNYAS